MLTNCIDVFFLKMNINILGSLIVERVWLGAYIYFRQTGKS